MQLFTVVKLYYRKTLYSSLYLTLYYSEALKCNSLQ